MSKLLIILDCTGSMQNNIDAIKAAMTQLFSIKTLTGSIIPIQFILYRDYCIPNCCNWTIKSSPVMNDITQVMSFIQYINAQGGGDTPEACKTALVSAWDMIDDNTIVFIYTDAPPHDDITLNYLHQNNKNYRHASWDTIMDAFTTLHTNLQRQGIRNMSVSNGILEAANIGQHYSIWSNIVNDPKYRMLRSKNQIYILTVMPNTSMITWYSALGTYINMKQSSASAITNITIGLFLNLIGVQFSQDPSVLNTFEVIKNVNGNNEINPVNQNMFPFPTIDTIRINLVDIITKFRTDDTFKELVFNTLDKLICSQYVMSLTTNDIFGKLWRECCKMREHPMLVKLQNAISQCCAAPYLAVRDSSAPAILKKWIANSYDNTDDILEYFTIEMSKFVSRSDNNRYIQILVCDLPQMARDDVLEIGRGTATFDNLRTIVQFLINVRTINYYSNPVNMEHPDDKDIPNKMTTLPTNYVPMCIPNNKFFGYLGHLMCRGTLFSKKSACILAILAYQSENPVLQNRAKRYLDGMIGRWLDIDKIADYPELLTISFIKLLEKYPGFLTDKEQRFFKKYQDFTRLQSVRNLDIDVRISWIPTQGSTYTDDKWLCHTCNNMLPISLMVRNGICAFCDDVDLVQQSIRGMYTNEHSHCNKSYMVMCRNDCCRGIYAVQRIKALRCEPKCYYCRMQQQPHNIECNTCHNKFVIPDQSMIADQISSDYKFKCPMCINNPEQTIVDKTITLGQIINENPTLKPLFGVAPQMNLQIQGSLFKNRDAIIECEQIPSGSISQDLTVDHRYVHNADTICTDLPKDIISGSHHANCSICYGDFHISKLTQLCGHCNNKVCHDCGVQWYSNIKPGDVLQPAHLCCAFCKKRPQYNIIRSFNPAIVNLMGTRQIIFDNHNYYAWCIRCNQIKIAGNIECAGAQGDPDFRGAFECDDCRIKIINAQPTLDVKMCPNEMCGIATEKVSGCNHITCTNCHTHWCYVCQDIFPYDQIHTGSQMDIYRHMNEAHGGWGFGDDYNDDDAYADADY